MSEEEQPKKRKYFFTLSNPASKNWTPWSKGVKPDPIIAAAFAKKNKLNNRGVKMDEKDVSVKDLDGILTGKEDYEANTSDLTLGRIKGVIEAYKQGNYDGDSAVTRISDILSEFYGNTE